MASPNANPYDLSPPRRPVVDDFDGCMKEDDTSFGVADPQTMPTAAAWNTQGLIEAAHAGTVPLLRVSVKYTGGNPVIDSATSVKLGIGPTFAPALPAGLTVTRTGGGAGAGDVEVSWTAGQLPTPTTQPMVSLNSAVAAAWNAPSASNGANKVRVITPVSGTPADVPFTVVIG